MAEADPTGLDAVCCEDAEDTDGIEAVDTVERFILRSLEVDVCSERDISLRTASGLAVPKEYKRCVDKFRKSMEKEI